MYSIETTVSSALSQIKPINVSLGSLRVEVLRNLSMVKDIEAIDEHTKDILGLSVGYTDCDEKENDHSKYNIKNATEELKQALNKLSDMLHNTKSRSLEINEAIALHVGRSTYNDTLRDDTSKDDEPKGRAPTAKWYR